jgi:hypothetical protein
MPKMMMRTMLRRLPILGAVAALWACPNRPVEPAQPHHNDLGLQPIEVSVVRDLDILFVIDNSGSMEAEQTRLNGQFDALMQALNNLPGGFPNAHIGVVSTDLGAGPYTTACGRIGGDKGKLQDQPRIPACTPPGDPFIDIANADNQLSGNIANVDTPTADGLGCQGLKAADGITPVPASGDTAIDLCDIQAAFRCIAKLGTNGCGFEHPIESARRALTCSEAACTNPGFLRDSAILAVVFLGDEDDCSARDTKLFDPSQTGLTSELGPLTSYRCFEFGITCDEPIDRSGAQTLHHCRSKTVDDTPDHMVEQLYEFPIQDYYDFFSTLKPQNRVVLADIAGPYRPGDVVRTRLVSALEPDVAPSCTSGTGVNDTAFPGIRKGELVRMFGANGVVLVDQPENMGEGICSDDFRPALSRLGEVIKYLVNPGCLNAPLIHQSGEVRSLIDSPDQATCTVSEVTEMNGGNVEHQRPACVFADRAPTACPNNAVSPGNLDPQRSETPCWYICDEGSAAEGGCPYRWQMRFCRDVTCNPAIPAPANTTAFVQCLSCNPSDLGCLCGDGVCENGCGGTTNVGENYSNCPEDDCPNPPPTNCQ